MKQFGIRLTDEDAEKLRKLITDQQGDNQTEQFHNLLSQFCVRECEGVETPKTLIRNTCQHIFDRCSDAPEYVRCFKGFNPRERKLALRITQKECNHCFERGYYAREALEQGAIVQKIQSTPIIEAEPKIFYLGETTSCRVRGQEIVSVKDCEKCKVGIPEQFKICLEYKRDNKISIPHIFRDYLSSLPPNNEKKGGM